MSRIVVLIACLLCLAPPVLARRGRTFLATANSVAGTTAKGTVTHEGIVAADPRILPLGSRIRVSGAGPYSGVYVVTDTGARVAGRKIDLYLRNPRAAKRFGKKRVTVRVLHYGHNQRNHRETSKGA